MRDACAPHRLQDEINAMAAGDLTASSPSTANCRLTGRRPRTLRMASQAFRNARRAPLVLVAPRAMMTLAKGAFGTIRASQGGELHSSGFTG